MARTSPCRGENRGFESRRPRFGGMLKLLIQIDTGYACAGVIINEQGIVIDAAPIFSWMKGKSIHEVKQWKRITRIEIIRR